MTADDFKTLTLMLDDTKCSLVMSVDTHKHLSALRIDKTAKLLGIADLITIEYEVWETYSGLKIMYENLPFKTVKVSPRTGDGFTLQVITP